VAEPVLRHRRGRLARRDRERLVRQPTFILCTLRSGSTLLRVLLDSHSKVHSPHELHLRYISVELQNKYSQASMRAAGMDERALEYLLWDQILNRALTRSGKTLIVEKTPNNVFIADRLRECWPDARFLFLLRHPGAIVRSRERYMAEKVDHAHNVTRIRQYCEALEAARQAYAGRDVRYEDLTADPQGVLTDVCRFLGVRFEPQMLDYSRDKHGPYRRGLGDWTDKIKSGRIQPAEPPPEEIPEPLVEIARAWGYVD
jgi:LPS sulfotransferase NodH